MSDAIDNLYMTFAHNTLGEDFKGCDCWLTHEDSARLATGPLRELNYEDMERYSRKAISTWGTATHFKYFLPRLLELSIAHRDDFLDLAVLFGKLKLAQFETWPQHEIDAVNRFFDEYWAFQLADPIVDVPNQLIDTVLCALSNALGSIQRFLDAWTSNGTDHAKRHFAAFVLNNYETLLEEGHLWNSFWDTAGKPHAEVVLWLRSDAILELVDGPDDPVLVDDFADAWPLLMAIRSALNMTQT